MKSNISSYFFYFIGDYATAHVMNASSKIPDVPMNSTNSVGDCP